MTAKQRQLENEDDDYEEQQNAEINYYMGAYCLENGGSIHIGLFTKDTCS